MDTRTSRNKKQEQEIKKKNKKEKKERRKKRKAKIRIVLLVIITLFVVYGFLIEPNMLMVNEIKLENKNIPESFHGVKVVHFSDLHYGSTINYSNIDKVVNKINEIEPDIVLFTGDLLDDKVNLTEDNINKLTSSLKNINCVLGKYIIIGNHDFYKEEFNNIVYDGEFTLLKNSYDVIYNNDNSPILIYGVDNVSYGEPKLDDLNKKELNDISYKIVLVHEPDYVEKIVNNYDVDLILSGHSHNGQVKLPGFKPFYTPIGSKNYFSPYYKVSDTDIYISNGIGTSMFKFRFGSIPSINFYRLNKIEN